MDQNDQHSSPKNEPSLDARDAFSVTPPNAAGTPPPAAMDAGDMPAWLNKPGEQEAATPRWRKTVMWLGGLVAVVALGALGSQWLLQEHQADSVVEINDLKTQAEQAAQSQAQAPTRAVPQTPALPPRASSPLPPLVLLPPEQGGKPKVETPTADGGAQAAEAVGVQAAPEGVTDAAAGAAPGAVPAGTLPAAVPVAKPVNPAPAAATAPAAAPATPAASQSAAPPAGPAATPALPPAVTVKSADKAQEKPAAAKPAAPAKAVAKPKPKPVVKKKPAASKTAGENRAARERGITLPPPRERASGNDEAPRARRCIPGELARECEARLKRG